MKTHLILHFYASDKNGLLELFRLYDKRKEVADMLQQFTDRTVIAPELPHTKSTWILPDWGRIIENHLITTLGHWLPANGFTAISPKISYSEGGKRSDWIAAASQFETDFAEELKAIRRHSKK